MPPTAFSQTKTALRCPSLFCTARVFASHILSATPHPVICDAYQAILPTHAQENNHSNDTLLIRRVLVLGIIVAREQKSSFTKYAVDDGTGVVAAIAFRKDHIDSHLEGPLALQLGHCVRVRGRLGEFRGERQISVDRIDIVSDPNEEAMWLLTVMNITKRVYSRNSVLPHKFDDASLILRLEKSDENNNEMTLEEVVDEGDEARRERFATHLAELQTAAAPNISGLANFIKVYIEFHKLTIVDFGLISGDPVVRSLAEKIVAQVNLLADFPQRQLNLGETQQSDEYEVIRHDLNLGLAILEAVRKCTTVTANDAYISDWGDYADNGVPHDVVGMVVREKTQYAHVRTIEIVKSLGRLQREGQVVEVLPRHYKDLETTISQRTQNLRRLEAQRNALNSKVRLLRDELKLLQEPGSYVGEVVKLMGKDKVLVKTQQEGKYVVDIAKSINIAELTPTVRVALRHDNYQLHKILPNKIDPLVSLMMVEKVPDSTYEQVGGLDRQIKEIKEVIELPVKHPELFESLGIAQPKGVLLYGPPGTGKTLLARAVAHHTDCKFIRVSGSELVQKYIGEGSRMVRELFVMAR
ncbi:26S proteasome regulatory subunit 8, partial [Entophlyctis luteolus]